MSATLQRLIEIMARLRSQKDGCPWDLEQTFETIAPYTIEETYELIEAVEKRDIQGIKEELGDVLFQVIFYTQLGREGNLFDFDDVANFVADKMVERHPHVFGERQAKTAHDVLVNWEKDKEAKRLAKAEGPVSALDNVSIALPAVTRAMKLQKRAASVGFDWNNARDVFAKIKEEIGELEHEVVSNSDKDFLEDEMGDVLFAVTNLARKLDVDPETALRRTNRKFERRFRGIEAALAEKGQKISEVSLEEMERLWNEIKLNEKRSDDKDAPPLKLK